MGVPIDAVRLQRQIEHVLERSADGTELLPLLRRLARLAAPGSEAAHFAHLKLAELLAEQNPWRAALSARKAATSNRRDDRALAVQGLCLTLLGHYRAAAAAYRRALELAPGNPWYAHNLGHLLDVTLGQPTAALPWLSTAYANLPEHGGIATSFAHALGKAGRVAEARKVLRRAMREGPSPEHPSAEHLALLRWLDAGAPEERIGLPVRPAASRRNAAPSQGDEPESPANDGSEPVERALLRGLERLPLDDRQRARARAIARAPVARDMCADGASPESVAAAVAYAIVYVDDVPLSQAEVAASFRVSGSSLRGRFATLRGHLHLFCDGPDR